MNRKHSIAVRCLALVLALVMILSNANLGLTMRAQAAEETGTLFELSAASDCGTKDLNAILAYAEALPKLNDETVKYETEPEMADALLRQDTLAVNAINGWVPYTYTVGGETKFACVDGPEFDGHLIDFDEAMARSSMYRDFERHAYEKTCNLFRGEVQ